ncbi:MAG: transposase [Lachnospiraceae bacterium]|nr:transposase [Lachnospiraceae bacterium]
MKQEEKQAAALLQGIPGIGEISAQAVISVIGTDMSRFPTDAHIASWAACVQAKFMLNPHILVS